MLLCMLTMRIGVELVRGSGFDTGFFNLLTSDIFNRAQIVYSIFIIIFLILSHYSPNTKGAVYMAASISIYFMAFVSSMVVMVL